MDRTDRDELHRRLDQLGCQIRGNSCQCPDPGHEDRNPSASIYESDSGVWRVKCHRCDKSWDVIDLESMMTGQEPGEILKAMKHAQASEKESKAPKVYRDTKDLRESFSGATIYEYRAPDTHHLDLVVIRIDRPDGGKTFMQGHDTGMGIVLRAPKGLLPLYNRTRVRDSRCVFVVEGEKCVHALHGVGQVATTSPGGASGAGKADWSPLSGKTVYLWPDNDDPGKKYLDQVAEILARLPDPPTMHRIDPQELPIPAEPKGDAYDFIAAMQANAGPQGARDAVAALTGSARETSPEAFLSDVVDERASQPQCPNWPWPHATKLLGGINPGSCTVFVGSPGASKSFVMLQCAVQWIAAGHKTAILELEDPKEDHLFRVLAQVASEPMATNYSWQQSNPEAMHAMLGKHRKVLRDMAVAIHKPQEDPTPGSVLRWAEDRAREGCRVIVIDPISALSQTNKPWEDDKTLTLGLGRIAVNHKTHIMAVHHPAKGQETPSLDGLAGGAAYSRFAQNVLWLEFLEPKEASLKTPEGRQMLEINRKVHVLKVRHGIGTGTRLGMWFSPEDLSLHYRGLILPKGLKDDHQPKPPSGTRSERMNEPPSEDEDLFA